jgi:nucleobase:cation symporter-1, NCS1 family
VPSPSSRFESIGAEVVPEDQRTDEARVLFWIWFAAGLNLLAITFAGSLLWVWKVNFVQALLVMTAALLVAMALLGVISIAGKWGGAHTLLLSRAPFGLKGAILPTFFSFLSLAGFEAIMEITAVYAAGSIAGRLGIDDSDLFKAIVLAVTVLIIASVATIGHATLLKAQRYLSFALAIGSIPFLILILTQADWGAVSGLHTGTLVELGAAFTVILSFIGTGWWNSGADYSRYIRPTASGRSVFWFVVAATFSTLAFLFAGLVLAAETPSMATAANPVTAITARIPTWFLIPYFALAICSIIPGAVVNYYSGALNLGALGFKFGRVTAAVLFGLIAVSVDVYVLFISSSFFGPLNAALVLFGAVISAWTGVFIADMVLLRGRLGYSADGLSGTSARYGRYNMLGLTAFVIASVIGIGCVSSTQAGFTWMGFILGADSDLAQAGVGVPLAMIVGAAIYGAVTLLRGLPAKSQVAPE